MGSVLEELQNGGLHLKADRCECHRMEFIYLDLIIGNGGVHMDVEKKTVVSEWPVPKSIFDVRSSVGFANFYRRFI